MMTYYDQHLHTHYSYDSQADFTDYLDNSTGFVVTTEHFDVANPVTGQTDAPDYATYSAEIDQLNLKYGNRILKGIEIGYYQPKEAEILAYLADKTYDLDDFVVEMDFDTIFSRYLDELSIAIDQNDKLQAHVLAHFDYGIRLFDVTPAELDKYKSKLIEIFQKMIAADLAFEINAKSTHLYHHLPLYTYALKMVLELGGTLFTLGSDGHKLEHYELAFDELKTWLKAHGVHQLVTFHGGSRHLVTI